MNFRLLLSLLITIILLSLSCTDPLTDREFNSSIGPNCPSPYILKLTTEFVPEDYFTHGWSYPNDNVQRISKPILFSKDSIPDNFDYFTSASSSIMKLEFNVDAPASQSDATKNPYSGISIDLFNENKQTMDISKTGLKYLTFWVKADSSSTNLQISLKSLSRKSIKDSVETFPKRLLWYKDMKACTNCYYRPPNFVGDHVPTCHWQKVIIPLKEILLERKNTTAPASDSVSHAVIDSVDLTRLTNIFIAFDYNAFTNCGGRKSGSIMIADVAFERDSVMQNIRDTSLTYIPPKLSGNIFVVINRSDGSTVHSLLQWGAVQKKENIDLSDYKGVVLQLGHKDTLKVTTDGNIVDVRQYPVGDVGPDAMLDAEYKKINYDALIDTTIIIPEPFIFGVDPAKVCVKQANNALTNLDTNHSFGYIEPWTCNDSTIGGDYNVVHVELPTANSVWDTNGFIPNEITNPLKIVLNVGEIKCKGNTFGGIRIYLGKNNCSLYKLNKGYLTFMARADISFVAEISLVSSSGAKIETAPKVLDTISPVWKRFNIPLTNLYKADNDSLDKSQISKVVFAFSNHIGQYYNPSNDSVYIDNIGFSTDTLPFSATYNDTIYKSKKNRNDVYTVIQKTSSPVIYYYVYWVNPARDTIWWNTRDIVDLKSYDGVVVRLKHTQIDSAYLRIVTDGKIKPDIRPVDSADTTIPPEAKMSNYKSIFLGSD